MTSEPTVNLIHGDCMAELPKLSGVAVVITDPPYGIGKADWDTEFPIEWYQIARTIAPRTVIITGGAQLRFSIPMVGEDLVDVIAARNLNGMTFGAIGFENWLAAVVAGTKPRQGVNCFDFCVRAKKPDHPCPKPIEYMMKLVERVTDPGDLVCDPFMGSGSTGVAAIRCGRRFVGIERDSGYYNIASDRIREIMLQTRMELE